MQKQWVQDISISQELAVTLIGQQFPGLSHIVVKPFSHGWDNILFQVNGKFVFRFPRRVIAVPLLERESRALPVLAHHVHLPVPDLLFRGQPTPEFPYPFFGYTMLSGRSIHQANLDETKRVSAAEGMATFLKELHGVPEDSIDAMQLEPDTIGRLDVGRRIPKLEEYLKDIADRKLYDDIDSLFQILRDLPAASPASARRTVVTEISISATFSSPQQGNCPASLTGETSMWRIQPSIWRWCTRTFRLRAERPFSRYMVTSATRPGSSPGFVPCTSPRIFCCMRMIFGIANSFRRRTWACAC